MAGEKAFRRLRAHLSEWFGSDGVDALLTRAIDRAQASRDSFGSLDHVLQHELASDKTAERSLARAPAESAEAMVEALATFIDLLGHLVGSEIAERLIEQSWDGATPKKQRSEP
jgi:hypothetical protein